MMRLDGFLAHCTALSRKDARRAIKAGRVSLDGTPVSKAATPVADDDTVTLDGQPVQRLARDTYLMLNKPAGVLSATTDASQPVVIDLLPEALSSRVHPVGRLDMDTTGLLLLTTDGQWSHRITSPRHHCPKTYRVTLAEALTNDGRRQLENGLLLRSEDIPTRPAQVDVIAETVIDLTITEGRYHQVKRMIAAIGNHVENLHRVQVGNLALDESLAPGDYRHLTDNEILELAEPQ